MPRPGGRKRNRAAKAQFRRFRVSKLGTVVHEENVQGCNDVNVHLQSIPTLIPIIMSEKSDNTIDVSVSKQHEENNYIDKKLQIGEGTINANDTEFECSRTKQEEMSKVNIKMEIPSPETCNIKVENGITCDNFVKVESCSNQLDCDECQVSYQDYCTKCGMLVHILDTNIISSKHNGTLEELPKNILEIRDSFACTGIFALKVIPEAVNFGPCIGTNNPECAWHVKGGRIIVNYDNLKIVHWTQYINHARNVSEQNLLTFQYEGNLYYRSVRDIQEGEELLVYFGEKFEDVLNKDLKMDFIPITEEIIKIVFACTFCCLGFNSKLYLIKHKTICPASTNRNSSIEEIVRCTYCKVYLYQQEYLEYHMNCCREKYTRRCLTSSIDHVNIEEVKEEKPVSNKHKKHQCETHKCSQCQYKTIYKADLKVHLNTHYEVKAYCCPVCNKRFKQRQYLNTHRMNVHADVPDENGMVRQFKCSKCDFVTRRKDNLVRHKYEHETSKRFNCTICGFQTNYKINLKLHVNALHSDVKEKQFKCDQCAYASNYRSHLNDHINAKHSADRKYKCEKCGFETLYRSCLRTHLDSHEDVKRFQCLECEFKTNYRRSLTLHVERKHDVVDAKERLKRLNKTKRLKCTECDFKTNYDRSLRAHTNAKHREINKFKCKECEYATNYASSFNIHVAAKHGEEKRFKCTGCEFATNYKPSLRRHMETKKCVAKEFQAVMKVDTKRPKRNDLDATCEEVFGI